MTEAEQQTELYRRVTFAESHAKEAKQQVGDARRVAYFALSVGALALITAIVGIVWK